MMEKVRVLLLADRPEDRVSAIRAINQKLDVGVEEISDRRGFTDAVRRGGFDVVIMDSRLQWGRSMDILRELKKSRPYCPFLLLLGEGEYALAAEAIKAGADDYVIKAKGGPQGLAAAVVASLERERKRQEEEQAVEALRVSVKQLRVRNRIMRAYLSADTKEKNIYLDILAVILRTTKSTAGLIGYIDRKAGLVCHTMTRKPERPIRPPKMPLILPKETQEGGIWDKAFNKKRTIVCTEPFNIAGWPTPIRRALVAPIIRNESPIGAILVANRERPYDDKDLAFLDSLGRDLAMIIHAKRQRDKQEEERKKVELQLRHAQKMEAIGRLTAGIAHDFNNLITIISGYADFLLMGTEYPQRSRRDLEEIKKAAERAAGLTHQLLAFSRKQPLQPVVMNLNDVIFGMEEMLRRTLGEDIDLEIMLERETGRVNVDPTQIEQVIMNLAINARDAMPAGGKLTIETANCELDAAYFQTRGVGSAPGSYVMLSLTDNGIGMEKETQFKIFDPFFTTKEKGVGSGLGLSTTFGIVKQSGGYIWVYSEPGKGTTFKIYLPRVREALTPVKRSHTIRPTFRGSETIMVVEDEENVRQVVTRALQRHGYRVLQARSGQEAMRLIGEHRGTVHLLITDVVMPDMGGREVAERLRDRIPQAKVIYMSGYTDNTIARHGILQSGINFIQKPFSPDGLLQKVRDVLDDAERETRRIDEG